MRTVPHVERLARLLHNRIVRRVLHAHASAAALLAVGDLVDGATVLRPIGVWDASGTVLVAAEGDGSASTEAWQDLLSDLRADLLLLARVKPVALFEPYVLDLRQLDLRLDPEQHDADDPAGEQRSY